MCQLRLSNTFDRAARGYRINLQICLHIYIYANISADKSADLLADISADILADIPADALAYVYIYVYMQMYRQIYLPMYLQIYLQIYLWHTLAFRERGKQRLDHFGRDFGNLGRHGTLFTRYGKTQRVLQITLHYSMHKVMNRRIWCLQCLRHNAESFPNKALP